MCDLTESQRGMIVGARLVGASAATVANIVGVSKGTVSNVIRTILSDRDRRGGSEMVFSIRKHVQLLETR